LGVAAQHLEGAFVVKIEPFHKDALGLAYELPGVDGLPQ
jgi:hypothetical protein